MKYLKNMIEIAYISGNLKGIMVLCKSSNILESWEWTPPWKSVPTCHKIKNKNVGF